MMRELDVSPVVWPAWCYSGEGQGETTAMSESPTPAATKGRGKSRPVPAPSTPEPNNNTSASALKSERLSPPSSSSVTAVTVAPPTSHAQDTNSSSSRSATPSSYPGTPPGQSPGSSPSLANRNYSDMMRSLAAKYNNPTPNDFLSGAPARNGATYPLDPRYAAFKAAPHAAAAGSGGPGVKQPVATTGSSKEREVQALYAAAASHMFPPLIDMSSSQALLNMVRTANQTQLETYLKGAMKRAGPVDPSSPLDLSGGRGSSSGGGVGGKKARRAGTEVRPRNGGAAPRPAGKCGSVCDHAGVREWSVEDVCSYVGSIEECAEYVQNFRAERIDGWSLAMLTESHLTQTMNMRLGPALKLRATLAARMGNCAVCAHCIHCHGEAATAQPTTQPSVALAAYRPASAD